MIKAYSYRNKLFNRKINTNAALVFPTLQFFIQNFSLVIKMLKMHHSITIPYYISTYPGPRVQATGVRSVLYRLILKDCSPHKVLLWRVKWCNMQLLLCILNHDKLDVYRGYELFLDAVHCLSKGTGHFIKVSDK